jgi:hypothetical protein
MASSESSWLDLEEFQRLYPSFQLKDELIIEGGGGVDRTGRNENGDPAFHGGLRFELGDQDRNKVVSTSLDPV